MPRFALLEHTGAPDDPAGRHYDLLLESEQACRTWRLADIPAAGGPAVAAVEIAAHRLAWLDHEAGPVSGGRGFARRIAAGTYDPLPPTAGDADPRAAIEVTLHGDVVGGQLELCGRDGRWLARLIAAHPGGYHGPTPEETR